MMMGNRGRGAALVAAVGVLWLAGCQSCPHSTTEAKQAQARADLAKLQPALRAYLDANGACRQDLRWDLLVPRYLERVPLDPWGRPYFIRCTSKGVTVGSYGADGAPGGLDENRDVVSEDML